MAKSDFKKQETNNYIKDVNDFCFYIKHDVNRRTLPDIVKVLATNDQDANIVEKRNQIIKDFGISSSVFVGANIAAGLGFSSLIGTTTLTSVPAFASIAASSLFVPIVPIAALSSFAGTIIFKYFKSQKGKAEKEQLLENLKECGLILESKCTELNKRYQQLCKEKKIVAEKAFEKAKQVASEKIADIENAAVEFEKAARKTMIIIDDDIHTNANKRIMRYNQIILNQYENQRSLYESVVQVCIKNQELEKQLNECLQEIDRLNKLIYTHNVITGSLSN